MTYAQMQAFTADHECEVDEEFDDLGVDEWGLIPTLLPEKAGESRKGAE